MKLYLNKSQRNYLLEVFRASESSAVSAKDVELAKEFNNLYEKIKPINVSYINLNRSEAEIILEFCDIIRRSLDKALFFLKNDKERDLDELDDLKDKTTKARDEIESVVNQLQEKIKNNPA